MTAHKPYFPPYPSAARIVGPVVSGRTLHLICESCCKPARSLFVIRGTENVQGSSARRCWKCFLEWGYSIGVAFLGREVG